MYQINCRDIEDYVYINIYFWIVKKCKEIAVYNKLHFDYIELDKQINRKKLRNVESINIDYDVENKQIIIVIKYKVNKPYNVVFINLYDEETTHEYYVNKK